MNKCREIILLAFAAAWLATMLGLVVQHGVDKERAKNAGDEPQIEWSRE